MNLKKRWIDFFYRIATGSRRMRNFFTPIGACFYTLLVVAFIVLSIKLDRLIGLNNHIPEPFNYILAIPIFSCALCLIMWSVHNFLKVRGTPVPFNPPPVLVTSGPYAYTRNPMLTGVFGILIGFGLLFGSVCLLVVFAPLFICINYWELKTIEEPELEKRLGNAYREYRQRTPMFFPQLKSIWDKKNNNALSRSRHRK